MPPEDGEANSPSPPRRRSRSPREERHRYDDRDRRDRYRASPPRRRSPSPRRRDDDRRDTYRRDDDQLRSRGYNRTDVGEERRDTGRDDREDSGRDGGREDRRDDRARSPPRRTKPKASGFKWKEKRRDDERTEAPKRLERGYRDRSPRREPRDKGLNVEDKFGVASKFGPSSSSVESKFGSSSSTKPSSSSSTTNTSAPPARAAAPAAPAYQEPMIIVHVNDRLGTKAAIPCLASDPVKLFKAQVAARIGRQPHEILLKRQGERPFKDVLTLADYGVSSGVQLDLEIDTGD